MSIYEVFLVILYIDDAYGQYICLYMSQEIATKGSIVTTITCAESCYAIDALSFSSKMDALLDPATIRIVVMPVDVISQQIFMHYFERIKSFSRFEKQLFASFDLSGKRCAEFPLQNWMEGRICVSYMLGSDTDEFENFQMHRRMFGTIGIAHCRSCKSLTTAYAAFEETRRKSYPGAIESRCFAVEPFENQEDSEKNVIMIPNQDEEHLKFYLNTLLVDFVSCLLRKIEAEASLVDKMASVFVSIDPNDDRKWLEKRRSGRISKRKGDLSLLVGSAADALAHYNLAYSSMMERNDWLWLGGVYVGVACALVMMAADDDNVETAMPTPYGALSPSLSRAVKDVLSTFVGIAGSSDGDSAASEVTLQDVIMRCLNEAISKYQKSKCTSVEVQCQLTVAHIYQTTDQRAALDALNNALASSIALPASSRSNTLLTMSELFSSLKHKRKAHLLLYMAALSCIESRDFTTAWSIFSALTHDNELDFLTSTVMADVPVPSCDITPARDITLAFRSSGHKALITVPPTSTPPKWPTILCDVAQGMAITARELNEPQLAAYCNMRALTMLPTLGSAVGEIQVSLIGRPPLPRGVVVSFVQLQRASVIDTGIKAVFKKRADKVFIFSALKQEEPPSDAAAGVVISAGESNTLNVTLKSLASIGIEISQLSLLFSTSNGSGGVHAHGGYSRVVRLSPHRETTLTIPFVISEACDAKICGLSFIVANARATLPLDIPLVTIATMPNITANFKPKCSSCAYCPCVTLESEISVVTFTPVSPLAKQLAGKIACPFSKCEIPLCSRGSLSSTPLIFKYSNNNEYIRTFEMTLPPHGRWVHPYVCAVSGSERRGNPAAICESTGMSCALCSHVILSFHINNPSPSSVLLHSDVQNLIHLPSSVPAHGTAIAMIEHCVGKEELPNVNVASRLFENLGLKWRNLEHSMEDYIACSLLNREVDRHCPNCFVPPKLATLMRIPHVQVVVSLNNFDTKCGKTYLCPSGTFGVSAKSGCVVGGIIDVYAHVITHDDNHKGTIMMSVDRPEAVPISCPYVPFGLDTVLNDSINETDAVKLPIRWQCIMSYLLTDAGRYTFTARCKMSEMDEIVSQPLVVEAK